jgi:hypothetical protein
MDRRICSFSCRPAAAAFLRSLDIICRAALSALNFAALLRTPIRSSQAMQVPSTETEGIGERGLLPASKEDPQGSLAFYSGPTRSPAVCHSRDLIVFRG